MFIENERSRLKVWLYPLEPERKHFMGPASGGKNVAEVCHCLPLTPFRLSGRRLTLSIGSCVSLVAGLGRKPGVGYSTCCSPFIRKIEKRYPLATAQLPREGS